MTNALHVWNSEFALTPFFVVFCRWPNGVQRRYVYIFGFRIAGWSVV